MASMPQTKVMDLAAGLAAAPDVAPLLEAIAQMKDGDLVVVTSSAGQLSFTRYAQV